MKFGVSGWKNLYLEYIGSDRRIFTEEVDPRGLQRTIAGLVKRIFKKVLGLVLFKLEAHLV